MRNRVFLLVFLLVYMTSLITFSESVNYDQLEKKINVLVEENLELQNQVKELVKFKNTYDKNEVVEYYKDMQSNYLTTVTVAFSIFGILITIGVVAIPMYSKYVEKQEYEKINKFLKETQITINKELEVNKLLKGELDNSIKMNGIIMECKIYENSNRLYEAIDLISSELDKNESSELYELLVYYYSLKEDLDRNELNKVIEKALKRGLATNKLIYNLGESKLSQHDYGEAITLFKQYIYSVETDYNGYYLLGKAYEFSHNIDEAILNYSKSIEINPKFESGYVRLAKCYKITKQTGNYAKVLEHGFYIIKTSYFMADELINYFVKTNNIDQAQEILELFEGDEIKKGRLKTHFKS